jgi:hypothetical protein
MPKNNLTKMTLEESLCQMLRNTEPERLAALCKTPDDAYVLAASMGVWTFDEIMAYTLPDKFGKKAVNFFKTVTKESKKLYDN